MNGGKAGEDLNPTSGGGLIREEDINNLEKRDRYRSTGRAESGPVWF